MPKSKFVDFKAIKSALTMEQILKHYGLVGQFKRGSDSLSGPWPIHKGSNPTQFRVNISKISGTASVNVSTGATPSISFRDMPYRRSWRLTHEL